MVIKSVILSLLLNGQGIYSYTEIYRKQKIVINLLKVNKNQEKSMFL